MRDGRAGCPCPAAPGKPWKKEMKHAGHFPFTAQPEEFAAVMGRFLDEPI
jgi:pimeloyl-ACP methyl ester carboxylesterase